ncbi:uncharacterized protein LOC128984702 [Macrosteles quadrilineatus]|uniref:uncharacterized protein LOC128984702 n=1 Tax=Macrosteles quadrilineatus TaxID=74068 RepID=UPI0023E1BFF4|nr:uncharacterized protein LOC128984702 [Macrosteles quadrilineatus]
MLSSSGIYNTLDRFVIVDSNIYCDNTDYYDHEGAASTLAAMNGKMLHGRKLKIEWASDSTRRKDYVIFVGDLCSSIDAVKLKKAFSTFGEISHFLDIKRPLRSRAGRSLKNIEAVHDSVEDNARTSIRRRSQQLCLARSTAQRILVKNLHMCPYKIQLAQEIKPRDPAKVVEESGIYDDIIQEGFVDSYNLTIKSVMMLKWVQQHCSSARFLMKSDDDIYLNLPALSEALQPVAKRKTILIATVARAASCSRWVLLQDQSGATVA